MSQTMRALVKRKAGTGIWMDQVPRPAPRTNEVLIKIEKTAIGGTDVHIHQWNDWAQRTIQPGLVIAPELVGRIKHLGECATRYMNWHRVSAGGRREQRRTKAGQERSGIKDDHVKAASDGLEQFQQLVSGDVAGIRIDGIPNRKCPEVVIVRLMDFTIIAVGIDGFP